MMKVPRSIACPECNHPLKEHQRDYSEEPFPPYWCDWCYEEFYHPGSRTFTNPPKDAWCYMGEADPEPKIED